MEDKEAINNQKYCQISFLPWAGLKKELRIGSIIFWPFSEEKNKIRDERMLNYLTKYFHSYVDHQGKPVDTITICSHGDIDFRPFNDKEYADLRSAVDILIFCTIAPQTEIAVCANNNSMGPPSAEVFQLITQNFKPDDDHIAVRSGSALSFGWKIGQISFPKPWSTGGFFGTPDTEFIDGFNKVFVPAFPQDIRERIFRSLEWFRLAHVESDEVSPLSKIVMMATAFEILLQVPNTPNKKKYIADEIEKRISDSDFLKETRPDNKGKNCEYTKAAWWGWDFYSLRNCIVHGDHIEPNRLRYHTPDRDWLTHLIVADLVFLECVKRELFNQECIGENVRKCAKEFDKAFPHKPEGIFEEQLAKCFLGFNNMHTALGWKRES